MMVPMMFMGFVYVFGVVAVVTMNGLAPVEDRPSGGWIAIACIALAWPLVLALIIVVTVFEFLASGGRYP